jgi:glycosyltransferase involved in cell wall biosynthesis
LKVLMLSKACVVGAYQRKLEEMVTVAPDLDLTVAVPPFWRDAGGKIPLERAHVEGYRLHVLPMIFNGRYHLHWYPTFGQLLRHVKPDIVHLDEEPYNLATYHANRLARRQGAKSLWFSWQNLHRHYPPPFSWMERYNLNHVTYAIVGSQSAAQVWRAKGYRGPLAVIPQFGVDAHLFHPLRLQAQDFQRTQDDNPVHIAYAGRLVPEKGVDLLLKALAPLSGKWTLSILGGGPDAPHLQGLCRALGMAERVTFKAPIPSVAMPDFYRTVDILVLPSRSRPNWTEQFGRVLIEAMASGVAVIGADTGEIPHVIGDAGLIFEEENNEALREVLARLLDNAILRQTLGEAGRARVLAHFTQRRIATQTVKLYQEMLQCHQKTR